MRIALTTLFAFVAFSFATCKKNDFCDFSNKKKPCDLVQSIIYGPGTPNPDDGVEGAGTFTQYRKEYNSATGKVTKVVAGIFELRFYDTLSMLLHYNGSSIYFTDEHHAGDTVLTARFDAANRLQKIETSGDAADHNFYSVAFTYGTIDWPAIP